MGALGRLVVELEMGLTGFKKGSKDALEVSEKTMREIEKRAAQTEKEMIKVGQAIGVGIGTAATAAAAALAATVNRLDEINIAAERSGIGAEKFQELSYAFKLGDANADALAKSLKKMATAASEDDPIFKQLGISVKDSNGALKSQTDLLLDLADKFKSYSGNTEKSALASKIFGDRIGDQLVPTLNLGREGIEAMAKELRDLGGPASDEAIGASAALKDNLDRLTTAGQSLLANVFTPIIKEINQFTVGILDATKAVGATSTAVALLFNQLRGKSSGNLQSDIRELIQVRKDLQDNAAAGTATQGGFLGGASAAVIAAAKAREQALTASIKLLSNEGGFNLRQDPRLFVSDQASKPAAPKISDGKKVKEVKEAAIALTDYEKAIESLRKVEGKALEGLTEGQKNVLPILEAVSSKKAKLTEQEKISLGISIESFLAEEKRILQLEAEYKARSKLDGFLAKQAEAVRAEFEAMALGNDELRKRVEEIGLNESALQSLRKERELSAIASKIEYANAELTAALDQKDIANAERKIQLLRERKALIEQQDAKTTQSKQDEDFKRESDSLAENYNRNFERFEDGFADALINGGRRGLAEFFQRELLESTVRPIVKSLAESITKPIFESIYGQTGGQGGYLNILGSLLGLGSAYGTSGAAGVQRAIGAADIGARSPVFEVQSFAPPVSRIEPREGGGKRLSNGGVTINQQVDLRGASDPAAVQAALDRNKAQTIATIEDMRRRGATV